MDLFEAIDSFDDREEAVRALNDNATFEEIHDSTLNDGDLANPDIVFEDAEPGQYVVFGATYDDDTGVSVNDGNLVVEEETTVFGVEGLLVQHSPSDVTAPDEIEPGDDAEFDIKTNLTGDNFGHTVLLYDESTFTDSNTTISYESDEIIVNSEIGDLNGNFTFEDDPEAVDSILSNLLSHEAFDDVEEVTFTVGDETVTLEMDEDTLETQLEDLLDEDYFEDGDEISVELGDISFEVVKDGETYSYTLLELVDRESGTFTLERGDTVLDASASTIVTDEANTTVTVETLEDWDETDYRWVHVAVNESGDMATSTGIIEEDDDDDSSGGGGGWSPSPTPPGDDDGDKKDKFDVSDASLSASEIEVGDSVDVSATVTNTGDEAGTYAVALTVDGDVVEERDVELKAGASDTVTFTRTFNDAGSYDIAVSGASAGTLTVVEPEPEPEPAAFDVSDAALSESEIAAGDSVHVTATVTNTGEESGTHTAELLVDGDVVAEQDVTVDGGESESVTFTETFDDAGEYDVAVDGASAGTLTVVAEDDDGDDDGLPGFGALVAIVALLGAIALRARTTDNS
ncbi:PGF-CTERM sorting domain-containing protein [Halobacteria archaeon AArc-m2/3/4]|uniref:PGF-CTERM sorting domain-containing protein n=1 Tax=Natronoglomus mannanivorans TaxID=2979990 RepID=A0ABT2QE69_9EURY|nr:PGF-CTERM sorting domain-containing protein [Halobacteria archaeon AArc-m2/3/4]